MKRLIFSVLFLTSVLLIASHAQLITVTPTSEPAAQVVAETIIDGCNSGLADRVARMQNMWSTLWENPRATPAEILAALGTKGKIIFQAAAQARADLTVMATLAGTTPEALLGDVKYLAPKQAVTIHSNGTVTLTNP